MKRELLAIGLLAISLQAGAAGIYRCTSPSGGITYQETACDGVQSGGPATNIPTSFPAVNTAERDRLLHQVALLEERELRRYEIDSRERIARDDRIAREREADAAIAMAAAAEGGGYGYAIGGRGAHLVPIGVKPHAVIRHHISTGLH